GVLVVAILAIAGGAGAVAWITNRAMAQTTGTLKVAGLDAAVAVDRDASGFAHITATTPHDLFMAQGYVHASERMWQMEVWRRISGGRLSEVFGAGSLDQDRFIRTLGWRQASERDLGALSRETRSIIDAYVAGVNAWLDANRDNLGLAFLVVGDKPEPWTALDTLAWGKVQAWNLGGNMDSEIFRFLADAKLGDPGRTDELFPRREFGPVIVPSADDPTEMGATDPAPGTATGRAPNAATTLTDEQAAAWGDVAGLGGDVLRLAGLDASGGGLASDHAIGSNDWVVAPSMSSTGGALLANDPHLGISMPSIWYVNGLHCATVNEGCPFDVAGVSFPGVPGVVLGHNARIAWGATNADPDVQDLVIETLDPADPTHYLGRDGTSLAFTVRQEQIPVSGGDPVTIQVRETVHGPILNDVDKRLTDGPLMALRWSATYPDAGPDRTYEAILGLNKAANFEDFRAALSLYRAPSQNFVYADIDGHIGYQLPGYVPIRSDPLDRGDRPVDGSTGDGEWLDPIPYAELPSAFDPPEGWIVTANNAIVDDAYPHFIAQEWDPGYRAERIIDLVNEHGQDGLTVAEIGDIQNDSAPLRARDIVQLLDEVLPATADGMAIADRIAAWDGACNTDSVGCAAYMAWEYRIMRDLFDDDLGLLARDYVGSAVSWVALEGLLNEPDSRWWDDSTTPQAETAEMITLRAMDEAGAELRAALGEPDGWTWGRLHTATFKEATIGTGSGIGPLEWYFNRGPVAAPGAAGAVNASYYRLWRAYPDPTDPEFVPLGIGQLFTVTNLPSYRLAIDMSDLDGARIVITTGQSGQPFAAHYDDQIEPWRTGGTVALPFTPDAVDAATVTTLTLSP
ncbi:MAG TPA: penicillin acylase family protein, partial [Methylomirabilota bacterium]|nr:penicillin acylase family protein [Methylomirabilota bacterium]